MDIADRGHAEDDANGGAYKYGDEDLGGDEASDAADAGANGDADADLALALQDGIVQHAVKADGGEQQGDDGEEQREQGEEAFADALVVDEFLLGLHVVDTVSGIRLRDQAAQRGRERERVDAGGAEEEGAAVGGIDGAGFIELTGGHVGNGKDGFVQATVGCVGNDADHLEEFTRAGGSYFFKGSADGVDTVEEGFDKGLVDDGLAGERISGVEVSTIYEPHLHGVKPAGRDGEKPAPCIGRWGGVDRDGTGPGVEGREERPA